MLLWLAAEELCLLPPKYMPQESLVSSDACRFHNIEGRAKCYRCRWAEELIAACAAFGSKGFTLVGGRAGLISPGLSTYL